MIYYVYPSLSSFVRNDLEGLAVNQRVIHQRIAWGKKWQTPWSFIKQLFHLIKHLTQTKVYIISFAGYHSFLPVLFGKIFRKKVFIVLNGTESVGIQALNYGSHLKTVLRWFCRFSLKYATELWPVGASLIEGKNGFIHQPLTYGVRVSFPWIQTPFRVIPNGFTFDKWPWKEQLGNEKSCVSVVSSEAQFYLKGIDLMLEFAASRPDFEFIIVGMDCPESKTFSSNVSFKGRVSQEVLAEIYQSCTYYFQLSAFEGFGCSLCEAMLCGCIPVGSNVNEIPTIINGTGSIVAHKQLDELRKVMDQLEQLPIEKKMEKSKQARSTVCANFPLTKRIAAIEDRLKHYQII